MKTVKPASDVVDLFMKGAEQGDKWLSVKQAAWLRSALIQESELCWDGSAYFGRSSKFDETGWPVYDFTLKIAPNKAGLLKVTKSETREEWNARIASEQQALSDQLASWQTIVEKFEETLASRPGTEAAEAAIAWVGIAREQVASIESRMQKGAA